MKIFRLLSIRFYGLEMLIFMLAVIFPFAYFQFSLNSQNENVQQNNILNLHEGDGPSNDCFISFSLNIIDSSVEFITCHLSYIFDNFVAYTPNLLSNGDQLDNNYQNIMYSNMHKMALILLPFPLFVSIALSFMENIISVDNHMKILEYLNRFLFNILLLILLPMIFRVSIDLNNAICRYIIDLFSPNNVSLSSVITNSINLNEISQNQFIPSLGSGILWFGFLISIVFIAVFFIIRFILIWTMFLIVPLLIALSPIPIFKHLREGIITKIMQFALVQPIFLLGIGFFLLLMKQNIDSISKFIIAICSLFTLGFIPSFIAGVSASRIVHLSSSQVRNLADTVITRTDYVLNWINEQTYQMPFEKPDK